MEIRNGNTKKCSFCGMDVQSNASRCPYCSSLLDVKIDEKNYLDMQKEQHASSVNDEEPAEYIVNPQVKAAEGKIPETKPAVDHGNNYTKDYNSEYQQYYNSNRQEYYRPVYNGGSHEPLSNGLKVFLTILFTVIPGLGQLAGIITGIVFMNSDDNKDKKSFGVAILVASIIMFVLSCIGCFILALAFSANGAFNSNGV